MNQTIRTLCSRVSAAAACAGLLAWPAAALAQTVSGQASALRATVFGATTALADTGHLANEDDAREASALTAAVHLAMGDLGGPGPGGGNIQLHKGNRSNTPPAGGSLCPV